MSLMSHTECAELVVIDAMTGDVLPSDQLFCCLESSSKIDDAKKAEAYARELAAVSGAYISPTLLRCMAKARHERMLTYDDFLALFDALRISVRSGAKNPDGTYTFVLRSRTQHMI